FDATDPPSPRPSPASGRGRTALHSQVRPMKQVPYWQDTAEPFRGGAQGPVEGEVDVAVVGGGFTGLSAALALAQQGATVAVLEAGRVVAQASGRNGGHVNNGTALDFAGVAEK